jgi:UDP-N-acetyl-D-mannosaminuronic acid dehydrogenase
MSNKLTSAETVVPRKVCILGVGFVGLTLGLALVQRGIVVYGLDSNKELVENLAKGETNVKDPGIYEALALGLNTEMINFIHSSEDLSRLKECGVFVVTVGTPLIGEKVDLNHIKSALEKVIPYISENSLVILRSTTSVGTADSVVWPILQQKSETILLAMCPERTIEGAALDELGSLPQIIGANDDRSFEEASIFFKQLGVEIVRVSSLRAAELTKLINNTYRDLMFGFANEIALFSQSLNISPREVINAANKDYPRSRISLPGPSGGPCLQKDPWILVQSAELLGVNLPISRAARQVNESVVVSFIQKNAKNLMSLKKISILGLSFKGEPEVLDARGSFANEVISFFQAKSSRTPIYGFEPAGQFADDFQEICQTSILDDAISNADMLVILTKSKSFTNLEYKINQLTQEGCQILDFWGLLNENRIENREYKSWI